MGNRCVSSRKILRTLMVGSAAALSLAACKGGTGAGVVTIGGATPTITPTPTPTPKATPTPSPTPTPSSPAASLHGLVAEGDSISVLWAGSYTGIYAKANPNIEYYGTAVGGAAINSPSTGNGLMQRLPALLAMRPAIVTVLIGANDLGAYPSQEAWLAALWQYVALVKASGAKVAVATVLPLYIPTNPTYTSLHNARRAVVNAEIRAAVGSKIDAVIDFAGDPTMGVDAAAMNKQLYGDGTHPTDGSSVPNGLDGHSRLAVIYGSALKPLLLK